MGHRCKHLNKGSNLSPILINKQISPGKKKLANKPFFFFLSTLPFCRWSKEKFSSSLFISLPRWCFLSEIQSWSDFYEESEDSISLSQLTLKYLSDSKVRVYIYFPLDYEIWLLRCIDFCLFQIYIYIYIYIYIFYERDFYIED